MEPYLGTQFFLVDLETGEMFAYIRQQWRRTGLYCSDKPFVINDLIPKVERQGQAVWAELEAEDQTPLVNIRRSPGRFEVPPPLPVMDEPAVYVLHPDVMQINTRKNYVRDRMRAALIYVSEYAETKRMITEGRYNNDDLLMRLRAVFGRVDQVRHHIDIALQQDDAHRRKRNMRFLVLPMRFPRPENMAQGDISVWTNWIREETDEIMKQLEEERHSRSDPDDPFSGTANGVFQPLQDPLSLPPPVQTPKRQGNNSEDLEHSQNSRKNVRTHNTASREERRNETVTSAQGEHSQNSRIIQQTGEAEREQVQRHGNAAIHSDLRKDSQNSLKITSVSRNTEASQKQSNANRGIHSEFIEHSQQSPGALNVGKSRVQAADQLTTRHIPLTGYENFRQELQTYPVSRDPMTVQPTGVSNLSNSAILDLPNVNTNLPPPLLPNPSSQYHQQQHNQVQPTEVNLGQVTNSEILKSIQSITEVMQQQFLLNSKTTEHGIVQTASLFQEMIKAQEKRDLDPALLAIPTFLGEAKDRPQCLDWVSRVKNVCDQSGRSFRQELINKSGILVQNFIRSLSENITNKELTEKILQFFSDVPTTSHALNKLRLIRQGAEEPIVNYNQRYQNLVERVEGCQLDSIRSTVAMELYLGSIIEPIRKSIRNTLYFNSKHAPKTLGEAMQKAQDLHIKHLYAIGEDQDSVTNSSDVLPEITVNEVTSREDRGWYRNKRDFREHSQNSREKSPQRREYSKQVTFNQPSQMRTTNSSEYSDSSRNSRVPNNYSREQESNKASQQPSVIRGSFTQIMVNPMQLQDHEFTAWLDRLVEARKNRQEKRQRPYRNFRKPYNEGRQNGDTASKPPLRNRIKPAQELEIQQIMDNFNCEYDDVVEAVDLYNLDVEECMTA